MRKQHWEDAPLEENEDAHQVLTQGTKEPRTQPSNALLGRKRPWDGKHDPLKANFEISEGLMAKMAWLKTNGLIRTQKEFVQSTLEIAADKLIQRAEKEGY